LRRCKKILFFWDTFFLHEGGENGVVGGSNTSDGIVSLGAEESRFLSDFAASSVDVVSIGDIEEGVGVGGSGLINEGVQESKGGVSIVESDVVEEREDGREGRSRGGGSSDRDNTSILNDLEENISKSRSVRSGASGSVVRARLGQFDSGVQIAGHSILLI